MLQQLYRLLLIYNRQLRLDNNNNNLIIFVKYPDPGNVKTRLAAEIGNSDAARVYRYIAEVVIGKCTESNNYSSSVYYYPPHFTDKIKNWLRNYQLEYLPQSGHDLGARMLNALEISFATGYGKTIIIGSDCIEISKEIIEQAFGYLDEFDVVIGPSTDGGYYLLGTKKPIEIIFNKIEWSTENVLDVTIEGLKTSKIDYILLEYLNDIDTLNDLEKDELLRNKFL